MKLKTVLYFIMIIILTVSLTGCGGSSSRVFSPENNNEPVQEPEQQEQQQQEQTKGQYMTQTEYISQIPSLYFGAASNKGQVITETYRSYDYTSEIRTEITKTAYVYLPYNYDDSKQYDILYLMHGWTMTVGDFFNDSRLINILDNLIANENIKPLIVVCATFDSENKSQSFSRVRYMSFQFFITISEII